jgi:hypothetical protein
MARILAVLATAATLGVTTMAAPAQAHWRGGIGPGLAFGLAAGAITAGALAATSPYYYEPGYYYGAGPAYSYGVGPYAYYGGPYYYRHHYWRRHW